MLCFIAYSDNILVLRNLCALEWTVSNPKGTADEFGTYYDGLSAEGKEVSILKYYNDSYLTLFDDLEVGKAIS